MEEIELEVANLAPQTQGEAFNLILKEKNGDRFLPVIIGLPEGRLIVIEQNRIALKRPFAHDVLIQLCEKTDSVIEKVVIDDYKDGIFYVHIHILRNGELLLLDSRVSDAVVIALKVGTPIFALASIITAAGYTKDGRIANPTRHAYDDDEIDFEPVEDEDDRKKLHFSEGMDLSIYTIDELNELLRQAIETENYEAAAMIDAELNKRPDYAKE
ncbi:MAG: bifunctional nuclease family protein [Bacteroidales bacterium]|nr:bifunctional nuclease family protein [Bacteroidales bacterium]